MKLSYEWVKKYVDIDVSAEELARGLTMSGSEVGAMHEEEGDWIMDLEITSNRPDCLNIIGLAREASAVFDKSLRLPVMEVPAAAAPGEGPRLQCLVKNKKLCPRYTARIVSGVQVKEVSANIKKHISALGLRSVNNVVDVTNFCLMETGQPLHAFDLDKITGGKIIIREAAKGERIVTIDGTERELEAGMLVIADSAGPVAIAGIMGGKETEVTETTKNVILESAYFDPISIRKTARVLGLSSDSSYRFERGVDKGMIKAASDRAAALIADETGGKICAFEDVSGLGEEKTSIEFSIKKAGKILGISLEEEKVKNILKKLGMEPSEERGQRLLVSVPSFREDVKKEIDLVEEVARIYGYDNIPAVITRFVSQVKRKEHSRQVEEKLHEVLPALGLNEIMTYSLISEAALGKFPATEGEVVQLKNPLSEEQKIMTPHLLDGMLKAILRNINRGNKDLAFFEIGKIYSRSGGKDAFRETPALCIGLTGFLRKNWQEGERPANLYDLKGIIEETLGRLKLQVALSPTEVKGLAHSAEVKLLDGTGGIGFLGEVSTRNLSEYDIEQSVYVCQLKLDEVIKKASLVNRYRTVARFPSSSRDISILCDRSLAAGEIYKLISETGEEIIQGIELVDVYEGEQIPADKKSLTYSIRYGIDTRTLTDDEVEAVHSRVKAILVKKLKITFR
ncbi:phenylalanine--tRNA ligase subunit beta [Candidatus Omnitrophota bacterium]